MKLPSNTLTRNTMSIALRRARRNASKGVWRVNDTYWGAGQMLAHLQVVMQTNGFYDAADDYRIAAHELEIRRRAAQRRLRVEYA